MAEGLKHAMSEEKCSPRWNWLTVYAGIRVALGIDPRLGEIQKLPYINCAVLVPRLSVTINTKSNASA